jgi:hypothetical protein
MDEKKRNLVQERIEIRKDFKYVMECLQKLSRYKNGHIVLDEDGIEELILDVEMGVDDVVDRIHDHINVMFPSPDQESSKGIKAHQQPQQQPHQSSLVSTSPELELLWEELPPPSESEQH